MNEEIDPNQYPQGKLNHEDEGVLQMAIGEEGGCVKIVYPYAVSWIAMPPDQAIMIGEMLIERGKALQSVAKDD